MADRFNDDRYGRDYPYNYRRDHRAEEDRRDRSQGGAERRSFGTEGEHDAWRRDRYGSRFDQDRSGYGSGYDAGRRDYGRGADDDHSDYVTWRDEQLRSHDRDYADWREGQHRQYDDDYHQYRNERRSSFGHTFHQWRAQRNMTGGMLATDIAPGKSGGYAEKTAHAGGFTADQDRPSGGYEPFTHGTQHSHSRNDGTRPVTGTDSEFGKEPPEVQAASDGDSKVHRK